MQCGYVYVLIMIKALLISILEHIFHPAESVVLGECCSVLCQQLLPVCVCVPAVKVWDVK